MLLSNKTTFTTFNFLFLWGVLGGSLVVACSDPDPNSDPKPPPPSTHITEIKVMSFNIWRSGGQSLEQTIEAIRSSGADVVGLQECTAETARSIARDLGVHEAHDDNGHAILTRFEIASVIASTTNPWGGLGATIVLGDNDGDNGKQKQRVHFFDVHLHYDEYGPYFLRDGKDVAFILERENAMRMPGLNELLPIIDSYIASKEPTFLVGDFNAPSHLDYADFAWPESLACQRHGLADSYRVAHPENRTYPGAFAFDEPGITWSPRTDEEPRGAFDRIDFIYYGPLNGLAPTKVTELDGRNSVAPWPSDHRAVLTTFTLP